jgi:hypothetical protein
MEMDTYECCICLTMMVEPVRITCGHLVCLSCAEKLLINGNPKCPMDRSPFDYEKDISYDENVFQTNFNKHNDEFMERATKIIKAREENYGLMPLQVIYGNHHELKPGEDQNKHYWRCFVKVEKSNGKTQQMLEKFRISSPIYKIIGKNPEPDPELKKQKSKGGEDVEFEQEDIIKKVTFNLHPTFNPPSIYVNKAPFQLSRIGWGTFNIGIVIEFQDYLKIDKMELDHMLSFSRALTRGYKDIYVDKEKLKEFKRV